MSQSEYRNLPLEALTESHTNPRHIFEDAPLRDLAESIRAQGVLSPLLVRPLGEQSFEIVAGARRFRAAQMAGAESVPVRIVQLSDAEALEAQLVENLQRRDVHPLEEAQGFRALLNLEEPKYSVEQIAAKTGKSLSYVLQRLKLTELTPPVSQAFFADRIGVGHALLLARLQPAQQQEALAACFREEYGSGGKKRIFLLPVRQLEEWIDRQILLELGIAPFSKEDPSLLPEAGACTTCSKRTGNNRLLFSDVRRDACTDPDCYGRKLEAHVQSLLASRPKLVQISESYGEKKQGSVALSRNQYVVIETPSRAKGERDWPQYKRCRHMTQAIVTEGVSRGELRTVCADPECSVHHPKRQASGDARFKAEQGKRRREEAIARAVGMRVLEAIRAAIPVRLGKRDLLFLAQRFVAGLQPDRLELLLKLHGAGREKEPTQAAKLMTEFLCRADESTLGRLLVETGVLLTAQWQHESAKALREAAEHYKVDVEAIGARVKQEFAAKQKTRVAKPASGSGVKGLGNPKRTAA